MDRLISEKAVLDVINEAIRIGRFYCGKERTIEEIKAIPSVEPKTEWIPVSERLPEDYELVLFSTKTNRVFEGKYFADNTAQQWYAFRDECFAWNNVVSAWMPLPAPFEPQESEEV